MEALILTCGTGGGHSAAAEAIREELEHRGDHALVLNPYTLRSSRLARQIDQTYISLVQTAPRIFGIVYAMGELYRHLPWKSPVYHCNRRAAEDLNRYLCQHKTDVVLATHLFPAEILTQMKKRGMETPPSVYVATDYTCVPFTEETDCDAVVIPARELTAEFRRKGVPEEKLHPLGIPVRRAFTDSLSREEARKALHLEPDGRYLVIAGGSVGAGGLERTIRRFFRQEDIRLIVICGNNEKLYRKLKRKYGDEITLIRHTDQMALYLGACDLYLTKPGGLCSTEAAVMGTRLVHFPPIPGCETKNANFFHSHGMSLLFRCSRKETEEILSRMGDETLWRNLTARQRETIPASAAGNICDLARMLAEGDKR